MSDLQTRTIGIIVVVCLCLFGCTLPARFYQVTPDGEKQVDWATLWPVVIDLASPDRVDNLNGIGAVIGQENAEMFATIWNAVFLGLKAARAIDTGTMPRDLRVAEAVARYDQEVSKD